jgi:uncharacterized protein (TIGR04141 family)
VGDRCFALSFGQVLHHIKDAAYEYDFGLIVTLNSLDPSKLKSADMVEPGEARRKRTQVPVSTELTYLDFDGNSEIIRSLTGKVRKKYFGIFKSATGGASLKIGLKLEANQLHKLCRILLKLYKRDDYKAAFPNIQNIAPIKDPEDVAELDARLLQAIQIQDEEVALTIPDLVDYRDNTCCIFHGAGESEVYPDISIQEFYNYLGPNFDFGALTIEEVKRYRLVLSDVEGDLGPSYPIYKSLIFSATLENGGPQFHLCEGNWYRVDQDYATRLRTYLDAKCEPSDLCAYNHDEVADGKRLYSEGRYNAAVPNWQDRFICLDKTNISPGNATQIEPCDLYTVVDDPTSQSGHRAKFYHIKISTRSAQLSHLFNQGVNAIELVEREQVSREMLRQLIIERLNGNNEDVYTTAIDGGEFKVVFAIITRKNPGGRSDNLPLFSKITLMRNMQTLDLYKVRSALTYIDDQSPQKDGFSRHRKIVVQVYELPNGKKIVRPIVGQGVDVEAAVSGCTKEILQSIAGSRFMISIRERPDGRLSTSFKWQYEPVN